jgi:hypothetical protein
MLPYNDLLTVVLLRYAVLYLTNCLGHCPVVRVELEYFAQIRNPGADGTICF